MGHRLSKIVTRTGDAGTTGLGDGSRVAKDSPRIEAIGAVDELNSTLGVLLAEDAARRRSPRCLTTVQHDLFDLGGELSIPGLHRGDRRARRAARGRRRALQRRPRAAQGIHPARRHARRRARARRRAPSAGAPSARSSRLAADRSGQRPGAQLPEPPVRPAVRARARAQPRAERADVLWRKDRAMPATLARDRVRRDGAPMASIPRSSSSAARACGAARAHRAGRPGGVRASSTA